MLEYQVDLSLKDSSGNNVMMLTLSIYNKNPGKYFKIIEMLLEKEPTLAESENNETSALFVAVELGNKKLVKMLLDRKANPDYVNSEQETVLHVIGKRFKNR